MVGCCTGKHWVQYHNSPGGVSRASDNLVVIQEATAGQVTWQESKHIDWIIHLCWLCFLVKGRSFTSLLSAQRKRSYWKYSENAMCSGFRGNESTNSIPEKKKEKEKSCRVSPGSWLAPIIHPLLAGRVYVPLPIARELELKCWHTSCIMWHWSDECSLPKSSTLSLVCTGIRLDQLLLLSRKTHHVTGICRC